MPISLFDFCRLVKHFRSKEDILTDVDRPPIGYEVHQEVGVAGIVPYR
jgi:hypothetical protein